VDKIWTDEYEDTVHVVFECLDLSLVTTLGFLSVKGPESVGAAVKVAYHALFFGLSARVVARCDVDRPFVKRYSFLNESYHWDLHDTS
jgi:hypothetical protein